MPEIIGGAVYQLDLDQSRYQRGLRDAEGAAKGLGARLTGGIAPAQGEFDKLGTAATKSGLSLGNFTRTAAAMGVGLIGTQTVMGGVRAAFDGTIGSAVRFESAMANVAKTSGASDAEIKRLGSQFRALSKEFPTTATGLAKIAATAAQVGITTPDLAAFTEVMAKLDTAIEGMDAESATVAIARFSNIMGTAVGDVDNLAAALVDLGNKGASTEAEILEFAQRLAGAGNTLGLSEQDVLGLSNALASLGLNAEAGGTAFSRIMLEIFSASKQGAKGVGLFADTAGITADAFLRLVQTNPVEAILAFVGGLGRINEEGGNVIAILEELELNDMRVRDSLLRTSGAQDLVRKSIENANVAWTENTALEAEAAKQAETTAARIQILKNRFADIGLEVGRVAIPALKGVVDTLIAIDASSRLVSGRLFGIDFGKLPGPLGAAAGVSRKDIPVVGGGGFDKALAEAKRLTETQARLTADANLSVIASLGGVAPVAVAAAAAVTTLSTRYEGLRRGLEEAEDAQKELTKAIGDAESVFTSMNPVVQGNEAIIAENERQVAGLIARYGKDMPPAMQGLIDGYEAQNKKLLELNNVYATSGNTIKQYAESIDATATRQGLAVGTGTLLARALVGVTDDAGNTITALQGVQRVLNATSAKAAIDELGKLKKSLDPKVYAEIASAIGPAITGKITEGVADPTARALLMGQMNALIGGASEGAVGTATTGGARLAGAFNSGLQRGIAQGLTQAELQIEAAVNGVIQAAMDAAGARSPSTRMIDLGEDLMSGLALGIEAGTGWITRASQKAVAAAFGPLQSMEDLIASMPNIGNFRGEVIEEDDPRWDWRTMGNRMRGPLTRPFQTVEDVMGTMAVGDSIRPFQSTADAMNTMAIADRTSFGQPEGVVAPTFNVYGPTLDEQERNTVRSVQDFFRKRRTETLRAGASINYSMG